MDEHSAKHPEPRVSISAELNTLNKLGIDRNDRVILLSSDNAQGRVCSEMNKRAIMEAFDLSNAQVTIHRIEGLQVHSAKILRDKGLKNLVKVVVNEYLANENIRYNYDIVINPTGGFKGVVPFLTVLGMLYGKRTVYMFEFADELINLPPLPFSFDMELYDRVRPALAFVEAEVAVTEESYLKKIKNFTPEERDRFMAFTEPFDSELLNLSPLAYCLVSTENRQDKPLIAPSAAEDLRKIEGTPGLMVRRLVRNSVNPIWREKHNEKWENSDLQVLKQINTAERIAGFIKNGKFCITHVFASHNDYLRVLGNYSKKDFDNVSFTEWEEAEYLGADSDDRDEVLAERDKLLVEKKKLETEITRQKKVIDDKELKIMELSEKTELSEETDELEKLKNLLREKELTEKRLRTELKLAEDEARYKKPVTDLLKDLWERISGTKTGTSDER
jgi:putative CRISPR-associated protein (TIGR02619 family)